MNFIIFILCLYVNYLGDLCLLFDIVILLALCYFLTGLRENRRHPATYLVHGAKALNNAFRSWTRKEVGQILFGCFIFPLLYLILSSVRYLFHYLVYIPP